MITLDKGHHTGRACSISLEGSTPCFVERLFIHIDERHFNESMMIVSDKPGPNNYLPHMRSHITFCCSKCAEVTVGSLVFFEMGRQKG